MLQIITYLKSSKVIDTFGVSTYFPETPNNTLAKPIAELINLSIKHNLVPKTLKTDSVTPVFKAGDKTKQKNYRSIIIYFTKYF